MTSGTADDQAFKTRDAGSYDPVAQSYDRLSDRFTTPMVTRLLALAQPKGSEQLLDVGTGTGIVTREAAKASGGSLQVVGVDLSQGMLDVAEARASAERLSGQITYRRMDAEALSLEDGSFDVVTSLFALAHFPSPASALREMYRVLRPGGRVVVAIGSGPALFSRAGLLQGCRRMSDLLARSRGRRLLACRFLETLTEKHHPESPSPEQAHWFGDNPYLPRVVPAMLRAAGFDTVRTMWQGQRATIASAEEFWELQVTFSSVARKRMAAAPTGVAEQLKQEFMSACRQVQSRGGTLVYPTGALFVTGSRPDGQTATPHAAANSELTR